jgi:SAM-dependent methyltransferase
VFEFPGAYYEVIRQDFRNIERETKFLAGYLPERGGSLLDLGCGTGTNLRALAGDGRGCVGVDQSAAFLEYARQQGGEGVTYHHCRAVEFESDARFDLVYSIFVTLNYMPFRDVRPVLAKVASWLKPEGRFVLDFAHLLNFVEGFRPYVTAHHQRDDVFITRLVSHTVRPIRAIWEHDESIVVSDAGRVSMYRNSFEQTVLTVPTVLQMMEDVGLSVVETFGAFDRSVKAKVRGDLVLVAQRA